MCLGFREARGFRASLYFGLLWFWGFAISSPARAVVSAQNLICIGAKCQDASGKSTFQREKKKSHVEPRTAEQKVASDKAAKKHTT